MKPQRIAILGAGISGLAAAYRLQQLSKEKNKPSTLSIFEATSRAGGMLQSFRRDGFLLETGPDCFLRSEAKPWALELCNEIGLDSDLIATQEHFRRSFIVRGNTLYPVPEGFYLLAPAKPIEFLKSPLLSWPGKLRAMCEPFIEKRPSHDESLGSFVRRRFGNEMLERMAQPLLAGIYAADPETLSLRATFPAFLEMEKKGSVMKGVADQQRHTRGISGARYSLFTSLKEGMQTLPDRLKTLLPSDAFHFGKRAQRLERVKNQWVIHFSEGESESFDAVCSTLPAYANATLLYSLDQKLATTIREISYGDAITVNIALPLKNIRHSHEGFGYVTPSTEKRPVFASTFVHRKFEGRVPEEQALLRAFLGGAQLEGIHYNDAQLQAMCWTDLKNVLQIEGEPSFVHVSRWHQAMPQFTIGHVDRVRRIRELTEKHPHLILAGNWMDGVGIPDAIATAHSAAKQLFERK